MSRVENLVIVESPAKARSLKKFLGAKYEVTSSQGHIRDLPNHEMGVDIANGFAPIYEIPDDRKKLVEELKKLAKNADTVWLASDEDREGEAISWHIAQILELDPSKTQRIVFHEITKDAILHAVENPRELNLNLVNAQQARRVLDRLVGYTLSPVLWRKVRPKISAGRVQSVALRLVVDKEREVIAFRPEASYKVDGQFELGNAKFKATLDSRIEGIEQARAFLQDSIGAEYKVDSVEKKEGLRNPAAPFTTSTLQQEAASKLKYPVKTTMDIAQSLYEKGYITYMRTDSTNLSSLALNTAKNYIVEHYGEDYHRWHQYKTNSKGAQEAHEAIRPTFIDNVDIEGSAQEKRLYQLIWKRTVASQMTPAKVLNTNIKINSDKRSEKFIAKSEFVLFDGFTRLYHDESEEKSGMLPDVKMGDVLACKGLSAECKYSQPPLRYSEGTLVKKLEELGIGRPSTYASIVQTLTKGQNYILKGDKAGISKIVTNLTLKGDSISESQKKETIGAEKAKFMPSDLGMMVSDFLCEKFENIMDYHFTASVEEKFDSIAQGELEWTSMISSFYNPFDTSVKYTLEHSEYCHLERVLGIDPDSGQKIVAKLGQYGSYVQKGDGDNKSTARLNSGQLIESITLEEALGLFKLPRTVGNFEEQAVVVLKGPYGPYISHADERISLPKGSDPMSISLEDCISIIEAHRQKTPTNASIAEWESEDIAIINGRYGPYIKHAGKNFKIPKGTEASSLNLEDCQRIISESEPTSARKGFRRGGKKK